MAEQIVECIPNFSEGRRTEVIDALAAKIEAAAHVRLLHRTSDVDHHRTVLTLAGRPQAVVDVMFNCIKLAAETIDLTQHDGVHPRLGATDVVPFVPIEGLTMADCVALSHQLGERVGRELSLPVYLYEAAATCPDRRNLADVRRGGYEKLKETIHLPQRQPDYGPTRVGNAGGVIIGARKPLIAYNVFLNTADVRIASAIARTIRHSSGGLAGVKALGLLVQGKAQVSMNLTDYQHTPLHRVMEMIRREALQWGVTIERSELIGLIPQDALLDAAAWYLQLHDFDSQRVLENRLLKKG